MRGNPVKGPHRASETGGVPTGGALENVPCNAQTVDVRATTNAEKQSIWMCTKLWLMRPWRLG